LLVALVGAAVLAGAARPAQAPTREVKLVSQTVRVTGTVKKHWETDRLYDGAAFRKKQLKLVGSDRALVIHYSKTREWIRCDTTLEGGTLHAQGYLRFAKNGVASVAVRSGTSRFAGMHGTLLIWDVPGAPSFAENVYRLR
jgi:hypothetical protein